MLSFHELHFSTPATNHFGAHFLHPDSITTDYGTFAGAAAEEKEDEYYEDQEFDGDDDDGLGYYDDGVKRTLTDEQIAIFRHSELEALRRARESAETCKAVADRPLDADDVSEGEVVALSLIPTAATTTSAPTKRKKKNNINKRKRGRNNNIDNHNHNSSGGGGVNEPIDLRKRTWDVVETGLATLNYEDDVDEQAGQGTAAQRRRISYDDD